MSSQEKFEKENNSETSFDYKTDLNNILSRSITPENIDTYAIDAFKDLVELTQSAISTFNESNTCEFSSIREMEDAAFSHYGLRDIGSVLDHIGNVADQIDRIGVYVDGIEDGDKEIILPSDKSKTINNGDGKFEKTKSVQRLKSLLFVLENNFEVDINDPKQFQIRGGAVDRKMMRNKSYYLVEVPKLERTIFICDEKSNATFILDSSAIRDSHQSSDDLSKLEKSVLSKTLETAPNLGVRLKYHPESFVPRLIECIDNPAINNIDKLNEGQEFRKVGYLYPSAPEDVYSANGLGELFCVDRKTVVKYLEKLGYKIDELPLYWFNDAKLVPGIELDLQIEIWCLLYEEGRFTTKAPYNVKSAKGLAKEWGIDRKTVVKVGNELGYELKNYRFGRNIVFGYEPWMQEEMSHNPRIHINEDKR